MPHLVVDLLLGNRAGALAHLLLHLIGGRLVLLLQLLLLLAVLQGDSSLLRGLCRQDDSQYH